MIEPDISTIIEHVRLLHDRATQLAGCGKLVVLRAHGCNGTAHGSGDIVRIRKVPGGAYVYVESWDLHSVAVSIWPGNRSRWRERLTRRCRNMSSPESEQFSVCA